MPLIPPEWVCFTCEKCKSVTNYIPSEEYVKSYPFCPGCGNGCLTIEKRTAVITEQGPIGAGPDPILDCLTAIANALIDIRNKLMAVL